MKLNKKGIASSSIIIVILLVLLVGSVGYICYDKFIKADEVKPAPIEEVKEKEKEEEIVDYKKIGCEAVESYLDSYKTATNESEKLISYSINSCELTSNEAMGYTNTKDKFYVQVSYDVEVADANTAIIWASGNGKLDGNTIKGKAMFATIEKTGNNYKVASTFTGW